MHYYQHHIGDFIRDTANLTDSQSMTYLRLIWVYYDTEQPIEDAIKKLAFKLGSDTETVELLLESFFKKEDDGWHHKRIDAEISAYHAKAEKARESANARWAQSNRNADAIQSDCDGNADAMRTYDFSSKVDANQEPITNNQEEKKKNTSCSKKKSSGGTFLAEDFELPAEWMSSAIARGMTDETCVIEFEKFRLHHAAKKTRSEAWARQWASWCLNWVSYGAKQVGNGMQAGRFNQAKPEPSWMAGGF
jgi:uncharacterized protein YdaU (DUF1376 family)